MIPTEYKIHFLSPAGALLYVVTDYDSFHLVRELNDLGELVIVLRDDHPALSYLTYKSLVEVWRRDRDHGLAWYCEARFIYLYYAHSTHEIGRFEIRCVDPIWLLSTRIIAWDVDTPNRTIFNLNAGSIAKLLVQYNITSLATLANGRLRSGINAAIACQNSSTAGDVHGWECAYENLLSNLQKLAPLGPGDFYLYYTGSGNWEFRWCQGQLGTDRSASLTFSIELNNMVDPEVILDLRSEKTVALVGGHTHRGNRAYAVYYSPMYSDGEDLEMWVPAPGALDADALHAAADSALFFNRAINKMSFNLNQTPTHFYGIDYFLGDLITTVYAGQTTVQKLNRLVIDAKPTGETSLVVRCE